MLIIGKMRKSTSLSSVSRSSSALHQRLAAFRVCLAGGRRGMVEMVKGTGWRGMMMVLPPMGMVGRLLVSMLVEV